MRESGFFHIPPFSATPVLFLLKILNGVALSPVAPDPAVDRTAEKFAAALTNETCCLVRPFRGKERVPVP